MIFAYFSGGRSTNRFRNILQAYVIDNFVNYFIFREEEKEQACTSYTVRARPVAAAVIVRLI